MAIKIWFVHSEWSLSLLNYTEPNRNIKQIMFGPSVADCWTNIYKRKQWHLLFLTKFRSQKASRYFSVYLQRSCISSLLLSIVLTGDEEPDPASRAHLKEGWQRGSGVCFLPPAALEEGRGSLKPTTLHLGGQYVSLLLFFFFFFFFCCI